MENELTHRPASAEDSKLFFEWANDPVTRANAFTPKPIEWEEHQNWFTKKLSDDNSVLVVFEHDGTPIGQVRVDFHGDRAIIDFSVAQEYRGNGYGKAELLSIRDIISKSHPGTLLFGQVKKENIASQKAFLGAGFEETESGIPNNILEFSVNT